jgi:MYXO-CTERM domain-containing protein
METGIVKQIRKALLAILFSLSLTFTTAYVTAQTDPSPTTPNDPVLPSEVPPPPMETTEPPQTSTYMETTTEETGFNVGLLGLLGLGGLFGLSRKSREVYDTSRTATYKPA